MKKKLIAFDMDGTITRSKSAIEKNMNELISRLVEQYYVCIVSGGRYEQFETQILSYISLEARKSGHLYIAPTSGACLYQVKETPLLLYSHDFDPSVKEKIIHAYTKAVKDTHIEMPRAVYGDVVEDRGSQLSFSFFGQDAPYEVKKSWDIDTKKRTAIREIMLRMVKDISVNILIGGTSTIDVVPLGIDKAYVLDRLVDILSIQKSEVLYVGDAVFPGGNDYAPHAHGYDTALVAGLEDTKKIIQELLK